MDNDDQKNEVLRKKGNSLTIPTSNTGLIDQALSRLGEEQLKQISAKALDEALNLEAMGKRVGFEYQLGQRQLNDHIDTVNNLKNSGDKSHHEVSTTLKVGDNRVYVKSEIGRSKTCFVATTVYGDENHPDVERFRRYRDERLHKSVPGRIFIVAYYRFGECLARFVNKHPILKNAVRSKLESFVRHLDKNGI